jgi:hypothetical protein
MTESPQTAESPETTERPQPTDNPQSTQSPQPTERPQTADNPRWRIAHLPMLTAACVALLLSAASVAMLVSGPVAALGAAAGVGLVVLSYTMSTLVIAWADTTRPALLLPLGVLAYVVKITLISIVMLSLADRDWPGGTAMAWGMVAGVVCWTTVQVWWVTRLARIERPATGVDVSNR